MVQYKAIIRTEMIEKRRNLQSANRADYNHKIFQYLIKNESFRLAKSIYCYLSLFEEVDTTELVIYALKNGMKVYSPIISSKRTMTFNRIYNLDVCQINRMGIREPISDEIGIPDEHSLFIVPIVAFDAFGQRIGYGGGYYDTYLSKVRPQPITIGIAYSLQQTERPIQCEFHDVKLGCIITENGYI